MSQNLAGTAATVLLALSVVFASPGIAAADNARRVIRVYDTTSGASDIRSAAIRTAAAIVADAGISVEWRDCTHDSTADRCQDTRRRHDLIVRIMPAAAPRTVFRGSSLQLQTEPGEVNLQLGVAVINPVTLTGEMATVFHEQVRTVARRSGVNDAELLGRALAHEIGHLLLRARAHSRTGLMRGVWSIEELTLNRREDWVFAPSDRERLQRTAVTPAAVP
jgi:hypothetical protein